MRALRMPVAFGDVEVIPMNLDIPAIAVVDEDLTILYTSDRCDEVHGYCVSEHVGQQLSTAVPAEIVEEVKERFEQGGESTQDSLPGLVSSRFVVEIDNKKYLISVIQRAGGIHCGNVNTECAREARGSERPECVTARQRQVLQLLADGLVMKEVAGVLGIVPRTVAFHKYKMMRNLGITTTAELIQFAVRYGIVSDQISQE